MSLRRNISLGAGLSYRGGGPYIAYIMHRIGGSALFLFFTLYILALLGMSFASALFGNWFVQLVLVVFGLFHAINGLRITILDIFPQLIPHFRSIINIEWVVYIALAAFAAFVILRNGLGA